MRQIKPSKKPIDIQTSVVPFDWGEFEESQQNLAEVYDRVIICDGAYVYGRIKIDGTAYISNGAEVCKTDDYIVFKNFWSSGRYFTWTRSNNKWHVGCFRGTGEELIKKAYQDSEKSGREYERVVRYVESILADEQKEQKIENYIKL